MQIANKYNLNAGIRIVTNCNPVDIKIFMVKKNAEDPDISFPEAFLDEFFEYWLGPKVNVVSAMTKEQVENEQRIWRGLHYQYD